MTRPPVVTTVAGVRAELWPARASGRTIGLVPTMGALHQGHLSLVRAAAAACDVVVVSIFVNPLQFAPGEDLDAYPRTMDADLDLLTDEGVALVFAPDPAAYTPADRLTTVHVDGLTSGLEAATRPTHFDGVTTIVAKLLNTVSPDRAFFGEKDFQQQAIIRRMAGDLDMGVDIVTCPVVREPDGLALSSRNRYLTDAERTDALALSRTIEEVRAGWEPGHDGNNDAGFWRSHLVATLSDAPGVRLDYAEIIDPGTLEGIEGLHTGPAQIVLAAFVGTTRLIDTARLG